MLYYLSQILTNHGCLLLDFGITMEWVNKWTKILVEKKETNKLQPWNFSFVVIGDSVCVFLNLVPILIWTGISEGFFFFAFCKCLCQFHNFHVAKIPETGVHPHLVPCICFLRRLHNFLFARTVLWLILVFHNFCRYDFSSP